MTAKQKAMSRFGFHEWPGTHIRHKAAADCRTYACLLLRDEGYSLNQTAKELGYADHTAVIWAIRRYDDGKLDGLKVFKEKNMRDEPDLPELIRIMNELKDEVRCTCSSAHTGRGLHDEHCADYLVDDIDRVIDYLTEEKP